MYTKNVYAFIIQIFLVTDAGQILLYYNKTILIFLNLKLIRNHLS